MRDTDESKVILPRFIFFMKIGSYLFTVQIALPEYTMADIDWLFGREKWKNLYYIGAIKTEFERKGTKTEEWYYYISSRDLTAQELLHHARMEWAIETMHWILDVHFLEDYCRIVNRTIQQNLNILRKFALNIIK